MKRVAVKGHTEVARPEINVTPLVDVVLVLLIIFMVVVPQMQRDVPVELPAVVNVDPEVKSAVDPLTITLTRERVFYLGERSVGEEELRQQLRDARLASPLQRVVLRADKQVPWSEIRSFLAMVEESGFRGAAFMVGDLSRPNGETEEQEEKAHGHASGRSVGS